MAKGRVKMKRTKSVIAMVLTAMLCFTVVCPALGAETAANNAALNEIAKAQDKKDAKPN